MSSRGEMTVPAEYEVYHLGDFVLQNGTVLPEAFIAYKTFGEPSFPAVIYPTWYSGLISDNEWLIEPSKTLDPSKYYIIIPALFGNSQSTSPSNSSSRPFPAVSFYDNVRAQHQLVTAHLGVQRAFAVLGWSMGAAQTFQWATQYPDFMDVIAPFCGSAKTSLHNKVFLGGVKAALLGGRKKPLISAGVDRGIKELETSAATITASTSWDREERETGLKALARVYAGWGFSQAFYREKLYERARTLAFKDLEDFMINFWEAWAHSKDPDNMLCMLHTWQTGDVSKQEPYNGNFELAMSSIKARALVLPAKTDLYFPPEDSDYEVKSMSPGVGTLAVFPSIWGHWAGGTRARLEMKDLVLSIALAFSSNIS